ncbi:MAG TPA: flagellar biosynthetic protein FliR, partial [Verrucomicrobiae bacterium]|nr:flagellar biosynthetic protein FliR [Verrucomicrobiae bacterium]
MFPDLTTWFVIFVRFTAYLLVFPVTAAQGIPLILRVAFSALAAFLIMPLVPVIDLQSASLHQVFGVLFMEVSVGLTLGMLARFLFYAVEIAGSLIATESGLMLSSNFNPITASFGS